MIGAVAVVLVEVVTTVDVVLLRHDLTKQIAFFVELIRLVLQVPVQTLHGDVPPACNVRPNNTQVDAQQALM